MDKTKNEETNEKIKYYVKMIKKTVPFISAENADSMAIEMAEKFPDREIIFEKI